MTTDHDQLATDLLCGAEAIAECVFGSTDPATVRRVYDWGSAGKLPTFKIGKNLCARRSTLLRHIEKLEAEGTAA